MTLFSQSRDFVVKNGVVSEGTGTATSSTGNTNVIQSAGGLAAAKNLIVGTSATVYGTLEVFSTATLQDLFCATFSSTFTATVLDLKVRNIDSTGVVSGTIVGNIQTSTNLNNGTLGQVPYQTGPGLTSFFGPGTAGDLLISNGAAAPAYKNTLTLAGTTSATSTNTGALQVRGGAGIGGNIIATGIHTPDGYANLPATYDLSANKIHALSAVNLGTSTGGTIYFGDGYTGAIISGTPTTNGHIRAYFNNDASTNQLFYGTKDGLIIGNGTTPGAKLDVAGTARITGVTTLTNTTNASATNSGALQIVGGVGVGGNIYVGGTLFGNATSANSATTATNIAGGAIGSIPMQLGSGATTFIPLGLNGYVLTAISNSATWQSLSGLSAGNALTATNLALGSPGQIPFQQSSGVTNFAGPGNAGEILVSRGASSSGPLFQNTLTLAGTTSATSTITGALQVAGGVGVQGSIFAQEHHTPIGFTNRPASTYDLSANQAHIHDAVNIGRAGGGSLTFGAGNTPNVIYSQPGGGSLVGYMRAYVNNDAVNNQLWYGAKEGLIIGNGTAPGATLDVVGTVRISSLTTITNTTGASSTSTGALQVRGGVGIGENLYVGGNQIATGTLRINNTSSNTGTAASNSLYVLGGAFIEKNLVVKDTAVFQGNVIISGDATYAFSTNTVVTDNLLSIHAPQGSTSSHTWSLDDGRDIGLLFHYYKTTDKDAFLGWNNASGFLEWYENGTETGGTFNGSTYGTFRTGGIRLVGGATNSGNTNTGDLQVLGGVGIANNLYVGGNTVLGPTTAASVITSYTSNNHAVASYTSGAITNTVQTVLDTFSTSSYRTAKYLIQIVDGTNVHAQEILITHINGNVYKTEYDIVVNTTELGTFDADISGGNCRLLFTAISPTSLTVKVHRTAITL